VSISIVAYDPDWPRRFAAESAVLRGALAPWLVGDVQHIGSTSVPGLAAKPIIDMLAGVRALPAARPAIEVLAGLGYVHAPHRPDAYWFYRPATPNWYERAFQLHLAEPGAAVWRERLAFRDALRADPALREEYQTLKTRLAGERTNAEVAAYTADKREFVARVLARAGIELAPARDTGSL
jgi:GrpB-like predicted nucleotidyltransferase (UPF0157 family)